MDCTVQRILQARILEWVAFNFSRGSSQSRYWTQVSRIAGGFFTSWTTREAQEHWSGYPIRSPGDLPNPGIEPRSPALQADSLPSEPPGKPCSVTIMSVTVFLLYLNKVLLAWNHTPIFSISYLEGKKGFNASRRKREREERKRRKVKEGSREGGSREGGEEQKAHLQLKGFPRTVFTDARCPGILVSTAFVPDFPLFN